MHRVTNIGIALPTFLKFHALLFAQCNRFTQRVCLFVCTDLAGRRAFPVPRHARLRLRQRHIPRRADIAARWRHRTPAVFTGEPRQLRECRVAGQHHVEPHASRVPVRLQQRLRGPARLRLHPHQHGRELLPGGDGAGDGEAGEAGLAEALRGGRRGWLHVAHAVDDVAARAHAAGLQHCLRRDPRDQVREPDDV